MSIISEKLPGPSKTKLYVGGILVPSVLSGNGLKNIDSFFANSLISSGKRASLLFLILNVSAQSILKSVKLFLTESEPTKSELELTKLFTTLLELRSPLISPTEKPVATYGGCIADGTIVGCMFKLLILVTFDVCFLPSIVNVPGSLSVLFLAKSTLYPSTNCFNWEYALTCNCKLALVLLL